MPQLSWHRLVTSFDAVSDFTIPLHLLFMTSFLTTLSTAWETVYWWYMCTSRPAVKSKGEGPRECVEISESGDDPQTVCSSRGQLGLCGRAVACPFLCTRQPAQIRSEDDFQSHNGIFSQRRERWVDCILENAVHHDTVWPVRWWGCRQLLFWMLLSLLRPGTNQPCHLFLSYVISPERRYVAPVQRIEQ